MYRPSTGPGNMSRINVPGPRTPDQVAGPAGAPHRQSAGMIFGTNESFLAQTALTRLI